MEQPSPEFFTLQAAVAGRYSLERELGRGGMGVVFLARDAALDRPVAIKMLRLDLAHLPSHRERFVREARIAARLSHPHIVPIHAVEAHGEVAFYTMAFVHGETLGARVARAGPLPAAAATRVVQEVAWALGHAHAHGIVHRDVKPDNILLEHGSGRALVTDFGIARLETASITSTEPRVIGTPHYMSPEQATGAEVDARSDLYSLGVVAFLATTGRLPIDGASDQAILAKQVVQAAPPVATLRPALPPRLAAAIDRCLAKDPSQRFESADDLAAELATTSSGTTDLAPPVRAFLRDLEGAGGEIGTALTASGAALVFTIVDLLRLPFVSEFYSKTDITIDIALYLAVAGVTFGLGGLRLGRLMSRVRDLLRAGFGHSAASAALSLTEREFADDTRPADVGKAGRGRYIAFAAGTVLSVFLTDIDSGLLHSLLLSLPGWVGLATTLVGIGGSVLLPTLAVREIARTEKGAGWWTRLVRGSLGRAMFRLARVGLDAPPAHIAAVGEPTAVAIAGAATSVFESLPSAQQAQFAEIPELVKRLEAVALELRARSSSPSGDARLTTIIAALDTLKLGVLRLRVDDSASHDLTRDIEAAMRIDDDIRRQLDARTEVERVLRGNTPTRLRGQSS